jgi:hypothetical protein
MERLKEKTIGMLWKLLRNQSGLLKFKLEENVDHGMHICGEDSIKVDEDWLKDRPPIEGGRI